MRVQMTGGSISFLYVSLLELETEPNSVYTKTIFTTLYVYLNSILHSSSTLLLDIPAQDIDKGGNGGALLDGTPTT